MWFKGNYHPYDLDRNEHLMDYYKNKKKIKKIKKTLIEARHETVFNLFRMKQNLPD